MVKQKLSYLDQSDEHVIKEMKKRLREIKQTLIEIRESLKSLGG